MRILHINLNYISTTLHQRMIEKLDSFGVENEVFVPTYDKSIAVINVNENVFVSECFKKKDRYVFDYKQSKIIKAIEEHYDIRSFDLIHAYTLFTDGNVARIISEKYGVPYVVAVRNTDVNDFFAKRLLLRGRGRKNLLKAKRIFFLSDAYMKQVFNNYVSFDIYKQLEDKTLIIPNGIDDFWLKNRAMDGKKLDKSCFKLVYAGGIDRNKNITATQKAMSILRRRGIETQLTVVGKIVQQKEYKKVISDKYTTYIPAQPKEKLLEIYRKNDIFIMPSIHESFGLVYAEAMSQGLPVIYTRGQGFDGQFDEGVVGYSTDPFDECKIAETIIKVANEYEIISRRCIFEHEKFEWDSIAKQYFNIYQQLTNK